MAKSQQNRPADDQPQDEKPLVSDPDAGLIPPELAEGGGSVATEDLSTERASKWIDSKKIPKPFRRSHLAQLAAEYCDEHKLDRQTFDTAQFLREQGLPSPTSLYRVSGLDSKNPGLNLPAHEIEAVDEGEAIRVYREERERRNPDIARNSVRMHVSLVKA